MIDTDPLRHRPPPADDPLTRFFWTSGADGRLRMLRCTPCGHWIHPPAPRCPECLSPEVSPEVLSGRGTVHTFTVNVQPWVPDQPPYVYAVIELPEQPGLRLTSNVVGRDPGQVAIGQPVRVEFLARHGVFYPLFVPDEP